MKNRKIGTAKKRTEIIFDLSRDFRVCGVIRTKYANKKQYIYSTHTVYILYICTILYTYSGFYKVFYKKQFISVYTISLLVQCSTSAITVQK